MDKLRQWIAITVVAILAVAAGGWFLLISPKHKEADEIKALTATQVSANAGLRTQLAVLKAQAKALPREQAKLAAVAAKIPDNPALPSLIRALTAAADDAGVELLTLSPSKPTSIAVPEAAAVAPVAPGTPGAAAAAGPSAGTLQSIGVSMSIVGGYFQVEEFLDRLESLSRAMKVSSLSMAPGVNPVKPSSASTSGAPPRTLAASVNATVFMASGRVTANPTTKIPGK